MNMRESDPQAFMAVFKLIVPMNEFHQVDAYIERLMKTGKPPKNRISLTTVVKMYRKVRGIKSEIITIFLAGFFVGYIVMRFLEAIVIGNIRL